MKGYRARRLIQYVGLSIGAVLAVGCSDPLQEANEMWARGEQRAAIQKLENALAGGREADGVAVRLEEFVERYTVDSAVRAWDSGDRERAVSILAEGLQRFPQNIALGNLFENYERRILTREKVAEFLSLREAEETWVRLHLGRVAVSQSSVGDIIARIKNREVPGELSIADYRSLASIGLVDLRYSGGYPQGYKGYATYYSVSLPTDAGNDVKSGQGATFLHIASFGIPQVTGLRFLDEAQTEAIAEFEIRPERYSLPARLLPRLRKRFAPNTKTGSARLLRYDDGWRVEKVTIDRGPGRETWQFAPVEDSDSPKALVYAWDHLSVVDLGEGSRGEVAVNVVPHLGAMRVVPGTSHVLIAGKTGSMLIDGRTGSVLQDIEVSGSTLAVASDGSRAYIGGADGIFVVSLAKGYESERIHDGPAPSTLLLANGDEHLLVLVRGHGVDRVDVATGERVTILKDEGASVMVVSRDDGLGVAAINEVVPTGEIEQLVSARGDKLPPREVTKNVARGLVIFDTKEPEERTTIPLDPSVDGYSLVTHLALTPDAEKLVVAGIGGWLSVLDVADAKLIKMWHCAYKIEDLEIDETGTRALVATAGPEGSPGPFLILDLPTGQLETELALALPDEPDRRSRGAKIVLHPEGGTAYVAGTSSESTSLWEIDLDRAAIAGQYYAMSSQVSHMAIVPGGDGGWPRTQPFEPPQVAAQMFGEAAACFEAKGGGSGRPPTTPTFKAEPSAETAGEAPLPKSPSEKVSSAKRSTSTARSKASGRPREQAKKRPPVNLPPPPGLNDSIMERR